MTSVSAETVSAETVSAKTASAKTAIEVAGLSKLYRRTAAGHRLRTLKSAFLERSLVRGLRPEEAIPALEDISFTVRQGEAVGVIGANGSGKSTLLKTLTGILKPTSGTVRIDGRVAALIELGAGFHPEISGRENIYINGAVLGLSRREIRSRYDAIVEFSGLAEFIDEPVKNYSSGMYVRLGFAVAIHTDPDVLMVDEVLAVGDEAFSHRCLRRIEGFLRRGKTLVLVSHSLSLIEDVCDRVLWLEGGRLKASGNPRRVADAYRASVAEAEGRSHRETKEQREQENGEDGEGGDDDRAEKLRWGSGEAEIEGLRILVGGEERDPLAGGEERYPLAGGEERYPLAGGEERYHFASGEAVTFEIAVRARRPFADFVFGIALQTPRGVECWGTNTDLEGYLPERLEEGRTTVRVLCPELRLGPGEYLVDVAVHARDGTPYDYRRRLASFTVTAAHGGVGVYYPRHRWSFAGGVAWRQAGGTD